MRGTGTIHVINHLRMELPERITSLPAIRITALSPDAEVPVGLHADVVFTHTVGGPNLPELLGRGVRWIQVMGVGVDKFPLDALADDQVLACARGATAIPISEFALAAMTSFAKAIPEVWIDRPPGNGWFGSARISGLHGRTAVIVGVGGIGSRIARLALAFDMRVIGVRRRSRPSPVEGMAVATNLAEVIGEADHLVLAAPATAATTKLVDADLLARAKPGLHIVNVARGALIDQAALRAALDDGRVARATLDAVDPEPLPDDHWMFTHPNVKLSPHVSWAAPGSRTAMNDAFVANYHRFRAGEPLLGVVERSEGY